MLTDDNANRKKIRMCFFFFKFTGFFELAYATLNIPPSNPTGNSYVIDMNSLFLQSCKRFKIYKRP